MNVLVIKPFRIYKNFLCSLICLSIYHARKRQTLICVEVPHMKAAVFRHTEEQVTLYLIAVQDFLPNLLC